MSQKLNSEPIDKKVAQAMVDAYAVEARKFPQSFTKAVWFPAEQVLEIAKSMSEGKYDGLRIYFGQYTPDSLEGLPKAYEGRNTLLLVPTLPSISNDDDEHKDDLDDIENRGEMCPEVCNGTGL
ncbi:hypothetical protein QF042_005308 [Pedobacter sp. W3I1]|uniref:hypothetical protein n=1 Tax=Pedobacter sp. W3I1 TaxID=3042291 RepID=UPI0027885810|nr:hypothetical protein [Pedobacter sp. W3I1]MDQ0641743.1 hypothetical protein [Pedobacter sp. W3I1]